MICLAHELPHSWSCLGGKSLVQFVRGNVTPLLSVVDNYILMKGWVFEGFFFKILIFSCVCEQTKKKSLKEEEEKEDQRTRKENKKKKKKELKKNERKIKKEIFSFTFKKKKTVV